MASFRYFSAQKGWHKLDDVCFSVANNCKAGLLTDQSVILCTKNAMLYTQSLLIKSRRCENTQAYDSLESARELLFFDFSKIRTFSDNFQRIFQAFMGCPEILTRAKFDNLTEGSNGLFLTISCTC